MSAVARSGGRSVTLGPQLIEAFMNVSVEVVEESLAEAGLPFAGSETVNDIEGGSDVYFALCEAEWFLAEARVALSMLAFALKQSPDEPVVKSIQRARRTINRLRKSVSSQIPYGFDSAAYGS